MGNPRWRRGVGTLVAVAAIAATATYAHANTITVQPVQAATGPNSTAKYKIVDETGGVDIGSFQFKVYYKSAQATLYEATDLDSTGDRVVSPTHNDETDIEHNAEDDPTRTDDPHDLGFDKYKVVLGDANNDLWQNAGDLAGLTFQTADTYTGQIDILLQPMIDPDDDPVNTFYIDGAGAQIPITISNTPTATYGSPVITDIDHEGTWLGAGDTVTVTGTGFFNGTDGSPSTTFTYNGQTLTAAINNPTQAVVTIPAFTTLPTGSSEYAELPLSVSNGSGYTDDDVTYTLVSQDKVYVDDNWDAVAPHMLASTGKIAGGNAFSTISGGVAGVNAAGEVAVTAGDYAENVSSAKDMTITAASGATLKSTGSGYHQVLMNVTGNVTIDGLLLEVDQYVAAAILSTSPNSLTVKNSEVKLTGVAADSPNRGLASVPSGFGSNWGTRGIAKGGGSLTLQNNTVHASAEAYMYAVQAFNTDAMIGDATDSNLGNNVSGAYRDLEFTYAKGTIANNEFALNIDVQNPTGDVTVSDNAFGNTLGAFHNEAALTVRHSHDGHLLNIEDNTFANTGRGIWVGASEGVTIADNTFTPADNVNIDLGDLGEINQPELDLFSDRYTHIMIDTRAVASNGAYGSTGVTVTGNTFNDSDANGDAIEIKNLHGSVPKPAMTLAFSGNTFNALGADDNYVRLHSSFTGEVNLISSNVFEASAATVAAIGDSWSLADLFDVENHTHHALDAGGTGVVRWVANKLYVTDASGSIQRGVDAATGGDGTYVGDTIHVQAGTYAEGKSSTVGLDVYKQVALLGPNAGTAGNGSRVGEAIIIPGQTLNSDTTLEDRLASENPVVLITADSVQFDGFAVSGENGSLSDPASFGGLSLAASTGIKSKASNVAIQNNIVEKFSLIAIWSEAGYYPAPQYNNVTITQNLVQNIQSDAYGYGYYYSGSDGHVTNNVALNVRKGMQIQPYNKAGTILNCSGNQLQAWDRGLYYNYTTSQGGSTASAWTLANNVITACEVPTSITAGAPTEWTGIRVETQYAKANGGIFTANSVDGSGSSLPGLGIYVMGDSTTTDKLYFDGNTVTNVATGLLMTAAGAVQFGTTTANEISNCTVAAIDIAYNDIAFDDSANKINIIANNNLHDNAVGVRVRNKGKASVNGNTLIDNAQQFAFEVTAANDAVVNTFNMQNLLAGELETVVADNAVTGKTYISTGMADTQGAVVAESVGGEKFTYVRNTIQGSVSAPGNIAATNTVKVLPGSYRENVKLAAGTPVRLSGSGPAVTTIVGPHDGDRRSVYILSSSIVEGFTLTRDGNNATDWATNKLSETVTIGSGASNAIVQDNVIADGRSGVYIEGANGGNIVRRNLITRNHTGMHLVDRQIDLLIENNTIVDNRTGGILFRGTGTGQSSNITIVDNNISGNWLGQIINRYAYSDVINASGNWLGTTDIVAQDHERLEVDSTHLDPAYADWLPNYYGGTHTAPGNPITVSGAEHELVDFNAYLASATEKPGAVTTDLAFQGDFSTLYLAADSPLAGTEDSHIDDAVALLDNGALSGAARLINVTPGTYVDGAANVDKPVQIVGTGTSRTDAVFNPKGTAGLVGISINADDVVLKNFAIVGVNSPNYVTAISRVNGPFSNTKLIDLDIANAGAGTSSYAVVLGQPLNSSNSTGNEVTGCAFTNCGYAGLALLGGETAVSGNTFTAMTYQGIYVAPDGATDGTLPVAVVTGNTFNDTPAGVRMVAAAAGSIIGGATSAEANSFNQSANPGGLAVSVEYTAVPVQNNTFNFDDGLLNVGVFVWNTTDAVDISGNTFTDSSSDGDSTAIWAVGERTGVLAGTGGNTSDKTNIHVSNNTFTGMTSGVKITDANVPATAVNAVVNGSNTFTSCVTGVALGANAAYAKVAVDGNTFDGNEEGINLDTATADSSIANNTFGAIDTSAQKYIVNTSGNDYDVSDNTFNSVKPDAINSYEYNKMFAIAKGLTDAIDETGNGYLELAEKNVYVVNSKKGVDGSSNGVLSRADLVAEDGDTIAVQPGTYADAVANINHLVFLNSPTQYDAVIEQPVLAELGAGSGTLSINGFAFSGAGQVLVSDSNRDAKYAVYSVQNNKFDGVTAPAAVAVGNVTTTGRIESNLIQNSYGGILLSNVQKLTIESNELIDNSDSGIVYRKEPISGGGAEADGIVGTGLVIQNNVIAGLGHPGAGNGDGEIGVTGDSAGTVENGAAYGVFVGLASGAPAPAVTELDLTYNTITDNAATGVALWYADGSGSGITIDHNTIENNGIWRLGDDYDVYKPNTDGLKLKNSQAVNVSQNFIRKNARSNVTVEGNAVNSGVDVVISENHLEAYQPITASGVQFGAGLFVQLTSPDAGSTVVDADDNWWGHVYGPTFAANATGRGAEIVLNGGSAIADTWYGQRDEVHKWYALNDRDGDGVLDADEDLDLSGGDAEKSWGTELGLAVKDTDNDGYEDGAEVVCGSDPLVAASTPADPNGDSDTADADPLAAYASYSTAGTDGSSSVGGPANDTDEDGYLDFYEVAQGTSPTDEAEFPKLGQLKPSLEATNIGQVSVLRRILVGALEFTDSAIEQDNGDLNRDGIVNNADLIFMRRFTAETAPTLPVMP